MEPFHIRNEKGKEVDYNEPEEIFDQLPPRLREVSSSSTAMESFNLMNDDLISHRIIPTLDSRLRTLISKARSGLIANRLRHLVDAAPPSPQQFNLLFRVMPKMAPFGRMVREMKFIECLIRDKRLSPFPQHEFTALTIPHFLPEEFPDGHPRYESFVEAIGHKIIFWNRDFQQDRSFCYILNSGENSDMSFRSLDTSTIAGEFRNLFSDRIKKSTVGDRLIVLLDTPIHRAPMFSLDVNSEKWSLLPECPQMLNRDLTSIMWKEKLYLFDMFTSEHIPINEIVPMHFDFQSNFWVVGGEENISFARCLMKLSKFLVTYDVGKCIISSKSGTLYAISHRSDANAHYGEYPIRDIYAMDDLATGWTPIQSRKSEHTQQVDPFKLPKLSKREYVRTKTNCWEINEHDILLVVLHSVSKGDGLWGRYAWWIFNKDDGVKNYGYEELNGSALQNASDISLLKIEM